MLHGIDDLGTGAEKIAALNGQLEKMGITNELIAAQANTTAVEYDKMLGQIQDAVAGTGQVLASVSLPALQALGDAWKNIFGDNANIAQLTTVGAKTQALNTNFLTTTSTLEAFNAKVAEYNTVVEQSGVSTSTFGLYLQALYNPLGAIGEVITENKLKLDELTPAQYAYAQSLLKMGQDATTVMTAIQGLGGVIDHYTDTSVALGELYNQSAESVTAYKDAIISLAAAGETGLNMAYEYNNAVYEGKMSMQEATVAIKERLADEQRLEAAAIASAAATRSEAEATQQAAIATNLFTQELSNNAVEATNAQVQSEYLKFVQEQLYNTALAASDGLITAANAAAQMKAEFGIAENQTYGLINALILLNRQKAIAAIGSQGSPDRLDRALQGRSYTEIIKYTDEIKKANKAEQDYRRSTGSTADQLAIARQELAKATKNTEEYWKARKRVDDLEEKASSDAKRGGGKKGSASPKLTANEKLNNQLVAQQDKFNNQLEDAEKKHVDNLTKIYEEYYKKRDEQQQRNEISKRRSRAGFYADNADLPEGLDPAKYAAQYEEAYLAAQKIAQEGSAQLADEYLQMRQEQIEELRKLDEEAARIQADDELSNKEKDAALAYLEGRRKLVEDAQAEELKQLLENGDQINKELADRLSEEQKMYDDNTAKIIENSDRAADAKIANAERSKIAVDAENQALAEQAARLDVIAQKSAKVGYKPNAPATSALPSPQAESTPASNTTMITADSIITVKQLEVWQVYDQAVVNSLGDMTARLESKIDNVAMAISDAKSSITGAVSNVERAVSRIKGKVVE